MLRGVGAAVPRVTVFLPRFSPIPARTSSAADPVGSEEHVREFFGDPVESLEMARREYVETAANPRDYVEFFKATSDL